MESGGEGGRRSGEKTDVRRQERERRMRLLKVEGHRRLLEANVKTIKTDALI